MSKIAQMTKEEVARYLDYSFVLDPTGTKEDCQQYLDAVSKYKFAGICLLPYQISMAVREIGEFCMENGIRIGGPVGFPYGQNSTAVKLFEAEDLIRAGATQLDMAANIAALKEQRYDYYQKELAEFGKIGRESDVLTKAIIHVGHLTHREIEIATRLVAESGVDQVKTATGLLTPGRPNFSDVSLMKHVLDGMDTGCGIKATTSSLPDAYTYIQMGCVSIGTGAGPQIVENLPVYQQLYFGE